MVHIIREHLFEKLQSRILGALKCETRQSTSLVYIFTNLSIYYERSFIGLGNKIVQIPRSESFAFGPLGAIENSARTQPIELVRSMLFL